MDNSTIIEISPREQRDRASRALAEMKAKEQALREKLKRVDVMNGVAMSINPEKYRDYRFEGQILRVG